MKAIRIAKSYCLGIYSAAFSKRKPVIALSGFCNRDVAADQIGAYLPST